MLGFHAEDGRRGPNTVLAADARALVHEHCARLPNFCFFPPLAARLSC
jgi:hypothetical protein